jgi:uncharacterized protein
MAITSSPRLMISVQPPIPAGGPDVPDFRPVLLADWDDAVFVHYAVDRQVLQPLIPFELELYDRNAYLSLVAFTQRRLRPRIGRAMSALLARPIASHPFLNVRTYIRKGGECGIYFLREWIPNRLATLLGPPLYGLPYRFGTLRYHCDPATAVQSRYIHAGKTLAFDAFPDPCRDFNAADPGSLTEFLLERYVAFTRRGRQSLCFRVCHDRWRQQQVRVQIHHAALLEQLGIPLGAMELAGANYSPGVKDVGLGPPVPLPDSPAELRRFHAREREKTARSRLR